MEEEPKIPPESKFLNKTEFTPTIEEIKEIRRKEIERTGKDCGLFEALIIYASQLSDYQKYNGPMKEQVIDTISYRKEEEAKRIKRANIIKKLREEGKTLGEIREKLIREEFEK